MHNGRLDSFWSAIQINGLFQWPAMPQKERVYQPVKRMDRRRQQKLKAGEAAYLKNYQISNRADIFAIMCDKIATNFAVTLHPY